VPGLESNWRFVRQRVLCYSQFRRRPRDAGGLGFVSGVPKVVFFDVGVPILKVPDRAIRQLHLCGTDQVRTGGRLK